MVMAADGRSSPPIVQYWDEARAPGYIAELMATFRDLNPDMPYRAFDEPGAAELIAAHHSEREVAAFRACAVPAMQADYFRYCALVALGGIYVDADFYCRRPLQRLIDSTAGGRLFQTSNGGLVNGFLVFPAPGHPLLRLVLEIATANIERRVAELVHLVTGPAIFNGLALLHKLGSLEAVRRHAVGNRWEPLLDTLADIVGRERVAAAFGAVQISTFETALTWIGRPEAPPAHKRGDRHWVGWAERRGTIFRG